MTTSPASDACFSCRKKFSWEWIPAVTVNVRTLPGTGGWRSPLIDGFCDRCRAVRASQGDKDRLQQKVLLLMGGEMALREFTLERFRPTPGSQVAFDATQSFNPDRDNLYLWGPCGVGKSHLAHVLARRACEDGRMATIVSLGGHPKTGHTWPPQKRPTELGQDKVIYSAAEGFA